MEQAKPELIVATRNVINAFLEGGASSDYQLAVESLFAAMREHGGRDALTDAVLDFKKSHLAWLVNGTRVDLTPLNAALIAAVVGVVTGIVDEEPVIEAAEPDPTPYLYILMRTDLASMNAGKAVAQGSHAANQMVYEGFKRVDETPAGDAAGLALEKLINEWQDAANGFGTCIVLGVNEAEMRATVEAATAAGHHAGITHDPSYPVRDGASFYTLPLDTCGYVFGRKCEVASFVKNFRLMP